MYKRYIRKNGKRIGPYFYTSIRQGARVKSVYLGSDLEKAKALISKLFNNKRARAHYFALFIIAVIALSGLASVWYFGESITGFVVRAQFNEKVDPEIVKEFKTQDEADVIIILKKEQPELPKPKTREEKITWLKEKRKRVKRVQDEVLADIDYVGWNELTNNSQNISVKKKHQFRLKHKYSTLHALAGKITKGGIKTLQDNPSVVGISLDREVHATLSESVPLIDADKAWGIKVSGINITGDGETICIIDTGIYYNHSDFGGVTAFPNSKVIGGYDYVNSDSNPIDDHGHGTHVAGIAAANGSVTGVAPAAQLVALKVLNATGSGRFSWVAAGIDWCVSNVTKLNISVISMSLGDGGQYSDPKNDCAGLGAPDLGLTANAIDNAYDVDVIVVAASGNEFYNNGIGYPACAPNATSVGSSDDGSGGTTADAFTSFTNVDEILDLIAPGRWITSTVPPIAACTVPSKGDCDDSGYKTIAGTSMSTPHVAGIAALMYQYERLKNDRNATPNEVNQLLKRQANVTVCDTGAGLCFPRVNAYLAIKGILAINDSEDSITDEQNVKVRFATDTDLSQASEAFIIRHNFIYLNASKYSQFNKTANLTFYNLTFNKTPAIYKDGTICSSPFCNITFYNKNLSFVIASFSNYTAGPNAQLEIFDDVDLGLIKKSHENISFFANYTNVSSGQPISTASCNISFSDNASAGMSYNPGSEMFEHVRNFTIADLYYYNVSCNNTDFEPLNISDDITVLPGCGLPPPGINWTINASYVVECNSTNLYFQNQTLILKDSASFILRNSSLILNNASTSYEIIIEQNANFTSINSVIKSQVAGKDFNLNIIGYGDLYNTMLNSSQLFIRGNKSHNIVNSTLYDYIYTYNNSINYISSSKIAGVNAYFRGSSNNYISNVLFNAIFRGELGSYSEIASSTLNATPNSLLLSENAIINFTLPRSNITANIIVQDTPKMIGYVDMVNVPGTVSVAGAASLLNRLFPVHVNFTNSSPAINKEVNVTNGTDILWQGSTDSNGLVWANLSFDQRSDTEIYNISVNPVQNISSFADTPIQFTLEAPDTLPPAIVLVSPDNNTFDLDGNITFVYWVNDSDSGIENCSLYINATLNQTDSVIEEEISQNFTLNNTADGIYAWNITCFDNSSNYNSNSSETRIVKVDTSGPTISLESPANNWLESTTNTLSFEYNVTDIMTGISNCSLILNSVINETDDSIIEETTQNFTKTLPNGQYNWSISCFDSSGFQESSTTHNLTIAVPAPDTEPPTLLLISPANNTFDLDGNLTFVYWVNDSGSGIENCSLYIDGILNQTNLVVNEGQNQNFTLNNTNDGSYNWSITCFDNSSNYNSNSSETRIVNVDSSGPIVNLENPANNTLESSTNYIIFKYNVSDAMTNISNCSLILNGENNGTDTSITESTTQNFTRTLPNGQYNWSIECYDSNGFLGSSGIYNLTIDVLETSPPTITLLSPEHYATDTDGDVTFVFNVTDDSGIQNCSLLIDGTINQTDTSITMGIEQSFALNDMTAGQYDWSIRCYDSSLNNNVGTSSERRLTVAICGDGTINGDEECDGSNLDGKTCLDFGFDGGTLACSSSCSFVFTGCTTKTTTGGGGGGGPFIGTCVERWSCTEWSECSLEGMQTRKCIDENDCKTTEKKPGEQRSCVPVVKAAEVEEVGVLAEEVEEKAAEEVEEEEEEAPLVEEKPAVTGRFDYGRLWSLLLLLPLLLLFMKKTKTFADSEVIGGLVVANRIKECGKLFVTKETYEKNREVKNLRPAEVRDKDRKFLSEISEKYKLKKELNELIVATEKKKCKLLTKEKISEELAKEFRRVRFVNPFKEKEEKEKQLPPVPEPPKFEKGALSKNPSNEKDIGKIDKKIESLSKRLKKL